MRVCVLSPEGINGKPITSALSTINDNISNIICLKEDHIEHECKSWIKQQKNKNIDLNICDLDWIKWGKKTLNLRNAYIIENSDTIIVVWTGNDKYIQQFIDQCKMRNINIREILINRALPVRKIKTSIFDSSDKHVQTTSF